MTHVKGALHWTKQIIPTNHKNGYRTISVQDDKSTPQKNTTKITVQPNSTTTLTGQHMAINIRDASVQNCTRIGLDDHFDNSTRQALNKKISDTYYHPGYEMQRSQVACQPQRDSSDK